MSELLEAVVNVGAYFLVIVLVLWLAYQAFGSQVFGLPVMIGVLVVIGVATAVSAASFFVIAAMVAGLLILFIVIGMAMSLGDEKPPQAHDEKPKDS